MVEVSMNRIQYKIGKTFLVQRITKKTDKQVLHLLQVPAGKAPEGNTWFQLPNAAGDETIWISVDGSSDLAQVLQEDRVFFFKSLLWNNRIITIHEKG